MQLGHGSVAIQTKKEEEGQEGNRSCSIAYAIS